MPETTELADAESALGSLASLLRPELADLAAYVPHDPPGIEVKLDANEAPPPCEAVRERVREELGKVALERYPDPRAARLKEAIGKRTGARPDELLVGTGSDETIALLVNALAQPRRRNAQAIVLSPTPTFVMYRVTARAHGLKPVDVPLDAAWDLDVAMIRRALQIMEPSVVFLASPNNPTGNQMSRDRVEQVVRLCGAVGGELAERARAGGSIPPVGSTMVSARREAEPEEPKQAAFVVVDEAYIDYAGPGASMRGLRAAAPHMGVLGTLSKIGLAALRVGWLEAPAALVAEIDKSRQPFNVSATSQAAAAAVLEDAWDDVQADVARVVAERERLAAAIARLDGFEVTPSASNFLWIKTPVPAEEVFGHLVRDKILVRSFHAAGGRLARQLRITVGTSAQHDRLLASLAEVRR